jgi:hypothetical protein
MVALNISETNTKSKLVRSIWHQDVLLAVCMAATLLSGGALWDHFSYKQCSNRASAIRGSVDHEYGRGYFVRDHQGKRLDMGHF